MTPEQTLAAHISRAALIDEIVAELHERDAQALAAWLEALRIDRQPRPAEAGNLGDGVSTARGLCWSQIREALANVERLNEYGAAAVIGGSARVARRP